MANLKLDLLNKLRNDKYFGEMELIRLAQEPNMNYGDKISSMSYRLQELAILNAQLGLVEFYFPEQPQVVEQPAAPAANTQQPVGNVLPGQSHGE
jgi:hypothetical protein